MKKYILTIVILTLLFMNACKETHKKERTKTTSTELVKKVDYDIVKSSFTDKDGNKLEMTFNNAKETATLNFKGETIQLVQQKAASGIWYKNDNYELRGKGEDVELIKDGKTVFKK
ncbi:MliC family protein [Marinifilum sp. RC60d5]|uniref:MliC family protein n=1 Tax=Marinifilum sp. RC60d5 TaxID=3458414 RepID=UPI004035B795